MLLELSYPLDAAAPKWPTNPGEELEFVLAMDRGDNCFASTLHHHMHNGTHVDAPMHFYREGVSIDAIPIDKFYFDAPLILRVPKGRGEHVEIGELKEHEADIARADLLALYMGYADLRNRMPEAYIDAFPAMTPEAASYLRASFPKLKAVALDVVGADDPVTAGAACFPVHRALLAGEEPRPLLIFEDVDLARMWEHRSRIRTVCAFPMRYLGAEAAPVNMVAICGD